MPFPDIQNHWAKSEIEQLSEGVVSGYPDGTFRPGLPVTRAEFVTMLVHAGRLTGPGYTEGTFTDVHSYIPIDFEHTDWFASYVGNAVANGITNGYDDRTFRPNQSISRYEAAVMLTRALKLDTTAAQPSSFTDADSIPTWAVSSVFAAAQEGIVRGYDDGRFHGERQITRAEAAVMIYRAWSKLLAVYATPDVSAYSSSPDDAVLGLPFAYDVIIKNAGGTIPENVRAEVALSGADGLTSEQIGNVEWADPSDDQFRAMSLTTRDDGSLTGTLPLGDFALAPAQTATLRLRATPGALGTLHSALTVTGVDTGKVYASSEASFDVVGVMLAYSGPSSPSKGVATDYQLEFRNVTDATLPQFYRVSVGFLRANGPQGLPIGSGDVSLQVMDANGSYKSVALRGDGSAVVGLQSGYRPAPGQAVVFHLRVTWRRAETFYMDAATVGVTTNTYDYYASRLAVTVN